MFGLSKLINMFSFMKKLFCNHNFEMVHHFEIPSEYDIVVSSGKIANTHCSLTRKYITDYKCIKCGKIKRLIHRTSSL